MDEIRAESCLLCIDCLQPAACQLVTGQGMPCGTYCDECLAAADRLGDALMAMMERAI